jgi:DNA-binding CsgD family transcriptional regulator
MELAAVVEGPLIRAQASHAVALARRDPLALEAASIEFENLGVVLLAAEASADAVVAWRHGGEPRRATAAARRAEALIAQCEEARTPALATTASARVVLTPRELEIARLASTGLTNREIADLLVLSRRTVENQLHSAYAKLGVDGRDQLAGALQSF